MLPEDEVLTPSGYRLDALVEVYGMKVGIEVDGPSHFMNQEPTGSTFLKRRQDKLGKDRVKKQEYLQSKLRSYPF